MNFIRILSIGLVYFVASCSHQISFERIPASTTDEVSCRNLLEHFFPSKRATFLNNNYVLKSDKIKVAFFDADGTVRITKSGNHTATFDDDVVVLPNVASKLKALSDEGYFIAIMSNQLGVGAGQRSYAMLDHSLEFTSKEIINSGGVVHYYDFAEYTFEAKPNPHMAFKLERKLKEKYGNQVEIDYSRSFMVGDAGYIEKKGQANPDKRPDGRDGFDFNNFDRLFAENLRVDYHEPDAFFNWNAFGITRMKNIDDVKKMNGLK